MHIVKVVDVLQPEVDNIIQSQGGGEQSRILADSAVITKRIEEFMRESMLDEKTLVGTGTDRASTMIGCQTGVATKAEVASSGWHSLRCSSTKSSFYASWWLSSVCSEIQFRSPSII